MKTIIIIGSSRSNGDTAKVVGQLAGISGWDVIDLKGIGYQTFDNEENPHLATSVNGCRLFVVDGAFLKQ